MQAKVKKELQAIAAEINSAKTVGQWIDRAPRNLKVFRRTHFSSFNQKVKKKNVTFYELKLKESKSFISLMELISHAEKVKLWILGSIASTEKNIKRKK